MVVGDFLLRDEGWGEVSAGAMRPEVRSGARLVGIGEERLRVDAHFDIATIEEGMGRESCAVVLLREGCRHALATNGVRVTSCEPVASRRCSLEACIQFGEERWSFETAGSHWAGGALAAIL